MAQYSLLQGYIIFTSRYYFIINIQLKFFLLQSTPIPWQQREQLPPLTAQHGGGFSTSSTYLKLSIRVAKADPGQDEAELQSFWAVLSFLLSLWVWWHKRTHPLHPVQAPNLVPRWEQEVRGCWLFDP